MRITFVRPASIKKLAVCAALMCLISTLLACGDGRDTSQASPQVGAVAMATPYEVTAITENAVTPEPEPTVAPTPTATPYQPQTITVRFVGDIMVSKPMILSAKQEDGTYDFDSIYDPIRSQLAGADLVIGNLETPIAGEENEGFTGRPRFNAPDEFLYAIKNAGFNVLTNANNHLLDRGVEGALTTIQKIRDAGFLHTGAFLSPEDADQLLITEVQGVRVAILAYSDRSTRKEKPEYAETMTWLANFNYPEDMAEDVVKAREQGADVVLVFTHMGKEGTHEPTRFQKEMAEHLVSCGVDAAIFSHPHAVQPFDRLTGPDGREIFVAYSLGNFLADGAYSMSRSGMILELPITVDQQTGQVTIDNIRYLPTLANQAERDGLTYFTLHSAGLAMEDETQTTRTRKLASLAWETVTGVVGDAFASPVNSFAS